MIGTWAPDIKTGGQIPEPGRVGDLVVGEVDDHIFGLEPICSAGCPVRMLRTMAPRQELELAAIALSIGASRTPR